jgi:hypothetical protein
MAKAAIEIVCMNNLKKLIPCLDNIKTYTNTELQTISAGYGNQ